MRASRFALLPMVVALALVGPPAASAAGPASSFKRPSPRLASTRSTAQNIVTGYLDPGYKPTRKDLVVVYRVEPAGRMPVAKVAEHLAAESSIGTWTNISTVNPRQAARLRPHIFSISKSGKRASTVKIAYPEELFEAGSVPQILSAVGGNVFGMKEVKRLRLMDIAFSEKQLKSMPGPAFGVEGIRKIAGAKDRPLIGTIIKPKVGLPPAEHARVAYQAWLGGLDLVKDDENLTNMTFNKFDARMRATYKALRQAEKVTGQKKIYSPNVTAATTGEMLRRAKLVKKLGGTHVMIDILSAGFSAVETLRKANLGLAIHGHRAGHAALTRDQTHGISMLVLAKLARAAGIDQLHVGTAGVGKMDGQVDEVRRIQRAITSQQLTGNRYYLAQDWGKMKPVLPIASGGLQPGQVSDLIDRMGTNICAQFGGGCHGHPDGTTAGAKAIRQAVTAKLNGIPLARAAKRPGNTELAGALQKWGVGMKRGGGE